MKVVKRNKQQEDVSFDKILNRVKNIGKEFNVNINYSALVVKVIDQLYTGISTKQIDELTAEQCASLSTHHPDYSILAAAIIVSNHQKSTNPLFHEVMDSLYNFKDINKNHSPLITEELYKISLEYSSQIQEMLDFRRDYLIDFFGFKTLERAYLMKVNKTIVERPQHLWMRVAIGIHGADLHKVKETYDLMSQKYFTHATPTLFNAGTPHPQLSSCYLIAMENDSIDGIYNTLRDCARISKWAGGIGLHIHNIRGTGSHIRGTNGTSNGIIPMLRVFNMTARYVDQCVTPETIIYTSKGPIEIQNCSIKETQIYNLNGEIETIENVLEHPYEGEMLNIKTSHSIDNLRITPEHPVYVLQGQNKGLNYNIIKNRIEKNLIKFNWIEAKNLDINDFIIYKIPNYFCDIENISSEDCYIYGVILGDGSMHNNINTGKITLHTLNKKHILDFAINYFEKKCIEYRIITDENTTIIRWNKTLNLPFRYSDFYDENKQKRMHYKWLNLPIDKCKFIVKGLIDTDGCNKNELVFDNTSRNLIESVRFICMKMGILTSGYIRDRIGEKHMTSKGMIENKKISYCLRIPKTKEICELICSEYDEKQFFKFFKHDKYLLTRIKNIEKEYYSGTLYDLQMKDEHNYMLHQGIVHNGGGKRSGSFAIYLEPWHTDIEDFLELRKNHGDEEMRCRDLFLGLWTPDLFMDRVKNDKTWSLFCPDQCPGLSDAYGDDFKELYETYEKEGKSMKTLKARELWFKILDAQMETGTPYILFKDAANKKSNQKNLGTIKSSNLCVAPETLILTDRGNIEIKRLENQKVNVWNGEEFSEVTVRKTGNNQELIRVNFSNNKYIDCTPYHKFYINFYNNDIVFEAQELKSGMKIINYKLPNDNNVITDIYVKNVENLNRFDNTFCFTEPKRHMGIFNGIIAGQCTEIIEYSSPDETAVCNLASISLGKFVAPKINYKKANVFSKSGCEFCVKAKALLKENNIFYEETILDNEKERKSFYQEVTYSEDVNVNSMPQIYLDDEYVGGYQNLEKLLTPVFNYDKLHEVTKVVTQNLNKIIDINFYPTDKTHRSNMLHRPIGIGIQGLADAFFMLDIPFHSQEAIEVNKKIFETMYHAALEKSMELSIERRQNLSELYDYLVNNEGCEEIKEIKEIKESKLYNKNIKFIKPEINEIYHKYKPTSDELFGNHERMAGHPRNKNHLGAYSSFENSPAYNGFLQFDMWNVTPSTRYDWNDLKEKIITNGMRNSLLIAPMPTASTSQILGNNECFEPVTSNIYTRRTLAGEFVMANKYLMCDLIKIGKWDENIKNNIIANKGSVQQLSFLSQHLKDKYKIVWEIPMKQLIDMSRDRGAFICQSQSLNLWVEDPDYKILTSMYFYAYQAGLKTGVYYLRRKPKHQAQQFTIEPDKKEDKKETEYEICEMCSA